MFRLIRSTLFLFTCAVLSVFPAIGQGKPDVEALGKQTFQMCVACHGPDGKGVKAGNLTMAPSLNLNW